MKHVFALIALLITTLAGCAVDTSPDTTSTSQDAVEQTVRTYHLNQRNKDGSPVFEERTVLVPRLDPALPAGELAKARQALATTACSVPGDITRYLVVWHDTGLSGSFVCFTGLGDMDLTNVYYSNPFVCFYAPDYNACVNNLRVSGNIRSVWNGDDGTSECAFLGPNLSTYEFYQYPTTPYYTNNAPANLVAATYVTCF